MKYITVLLKDGKTFEFMDNDGYLTGIMGNCIKFNTVDDAKKYIKLQTEGEEFKILIIEEIEYE